MKNILEFQNVWYASEKKALSSNKFKAFDASGDLNFNGHENKFQFKSDLYNLHGNHIISIKLGRQRLNWKTYLLLASITFSYMMMRHQSLIYVVSMILISSILGVLLFWYPNKWILITYKDKENIIRTAYFADGSYRGYRGLLGGTRKMFKSIMENSSL